MQKTPNPEFLHTGNTKQNNTKFEGFAGESSLPYRFDMLSVCQLHSHCLQEQTAELERQRGAIDEYNKQHYEHKKNKDQYQSARKWVLTVQSC